MVEFAKTASGEAYRFVLAPNCSISWPELRLFYAATCALALIIATVFTLGGLWLVIPFSGLEMLVLGIALYHTSRKVHRREVITLDRRRVRIEKGVRRVDESWEFETAGTRLIDEAEKPGEGRRRLVLSARGKRVEIGDFLDYPEKEALAFQLKDCIIRV